MIDLGRLSFSNVDRNPGEAPLPYVSGKQKCKAFGIITGVHILLLVVPSIFMAISNKIKPPRYVMRVPIVESLPNQFKEMSPHPSPLRPKSQGTPDYGKPPELSKIPELPDLEPEPKPQPKPQPKVQEKPQPKKKKMEVVKVDGKRKEKLVEKTKPKKRKTLSAEDIVVSKKVVKRTAKRTTRRPQKTAETYRKSAQQAARDALAKQLREQALTGTRGCTGLAGGGGGPKGIVSREVNEYYDKVSAYLKSHWEQPQTSSLRGAEPIVIIRFRVDSSGRILYAKIEKKSGIAAMDISVENLIKSLRALPVPPTAMEFDVTMEIDR